MRIFLCLVGLPCLFAASLLSAEISRAVPGAEGQRAFDDLAAIYRGEQSLDSARLWKQLHASDAAQRERAGQYLLAICQQSYADESSHRDVYSHGMFPGFGERPSSRARGIRKALASQLPDQGVAVESLPAIDWLLSHDILSDTQLAAVQTLRKIRSPAADDLLLSILAAPHSNGLVLIAALEEVSARNLETSTDQVVFLAGDYRSAVRSAARAACTQLGFEAPPDFSPEKALMQSFDADLRQIAAMVMTPIPPEAPFVRITLRTPDRSEDEHISYGWLLDDDGEEYLVLSEYASEARLPKSQRTIAPWSLETRARELYQLRVAEEGAEAGTRDGSMSLSHSGELSGQFEPWQLRLPEILVGAWVYQRNDKKTAAMLLIPRLEELEDRRWAREIARDLLGHRYHQRMLTRFADYWDYSGTLRLAKHLNSPVFDGYPYQYRAASLVRQLPSRAESDFRTLRLPTPRQWHHLRRQLSRADQIDFLADRLRLICCRQLGWPCDFNVREQQRSEPPGGGIYADINLARGVETINPFTELSGMALEPAELAPLIPHLAKDDFLLTYHVWRPWDSGWEVFPVNELVEALINESAGTHLADSSQYNALSPEERPQYLATLTDKALQQTKPRVVRALLDLGALLRRPVEPIVGVFACILACLWYWWRRTSPGFAALGAAVFLSFGMIAIWYPALRQQRVLLASDAVPPIICVVGSSILLRLRLNQRWTGVLLFTAVILTAAWIVDRYLFLGRFFNAYWLAVFVLLSWPCCRMLHKSRGGWGWALLASLFAIAAVAQRVWKDVFAAVYHFELGPGLRSPFFLTHAAWTLVALLACACLLQWASRQSRCRHALLSGPQAEHVSTATDRGFA